jgi:steroid delta-isomerase-like uncharacterized protein
MRHTLLALLAALALIGGGSAARSADTQALERALDQWAVSWSSGDVDKLLPLFTDDVRYEDVTFGAVNQGKNALRDFAATTFGAFADLKFELKSRLVAADGRSGAMEWTWRGGKQRTSLGSRLRTRPLKFAVRQLSTLPTERSVATPTIGIWRRT